MKTWAEVKLYIDRHKLPYSIMRFNMTLEGRMIDLFTGQVVASTVKEAAAHLSQPTPKFGVTTATQNRREGRWSTTTQCRTRLNTAMER